MSKEEKASSQRIAELVARNLAGFDQRATEFVKKHLANFVKAGLGIEESWNRTRVRDTNGFRGPIHDVIEAIAVAYVKRDAVKIVDGLRTDRKFMKDFRKGLEEKFRDEYSRALHRRVSELIASRLEEIENQYTEELESLQKGFDAYLTPVIETLRDEVRQKIERGELDSVTDENNS